MAKGLSQPGFGPTFAVGALVVSARGDGAAFAVSRAGTRATGGDGTYTTRGGDGDEAEAARDPAPASGARGGSVALTDGSGVGWTSGCCSTGVAAGASTSRAAAS